MMRNCRCILDDLRGPSFVALLLTAAAFSCFATANEAASDSNALLNVDTEINPEPYLIDRESAVKDLDFVIQELAYPIIDLNIVTETENEVLIELAADVLFDFDKANLKPSALSSLQTVAQRIRDTARGDVRIEGHTDSKGSNFYNQSLSEKRANSVRDWLVDHGGLTKVEFLTRGFGETKPAVPNETEKGEDDPSGRQRNRRVEIIINTAK